MTHELGKYTVRPLMFSRISAWCCALGGALIWAWAERVRLSLFYYIPPSLAQVLEVQSFPVIKCHSLFEFDSNSFFSELARSEPLGMVDRIEHSPFLGAGSTPENGRNNQIPSHTELGLGLLLASALIFPVKWKIEARTSPFILLSYSARMISCYLPRQILICVLCCSISLDGREANKYKEWKTQALARFPYMHWVQSSWKIL